MSLLFPPGIETVADLPYHIQDAISKGLLFLSFMEDLPDDERPPKKLWLDGDGLKEHFDAVKKRREEKFNVDGKESKDIEDPVQNDAARSLVAR